MKTIFITGASSGLGKAAAQLFHSNGWHVIATMRAPEKETELTRLENMTVLPLDVTNPTEIEQTVQRVMQSHTVDVVLNNAGYGLIGPLEALDDEQIVRQINTNVLGVIRVTKAFTPYFRESKQGLFLNVTSNFGLMGYATCSIYCATKFAVDGFSESILYDLAQFGVGVKIIAPGGIQTDFATRSLESKTHPAYEQLMAEVGKGYSAENVARYAKAEDIAAVIYEAATDGKAQLRYIAGDDAIAAYGERMKSGPETQVGALKKIFTF